MYKNLKAEMARSEMTQAEIARLIEISPVSFNHKITGKIEFTEKEKNAIRTELQIINARRLNLDYLFNKN